MFAWLKRKPASDWRTVAIFSVSATQTDWKERKTPYTATYVLKADQYDNRKVEFTRDIAMHENFPAFMRSLKHYLLHIGPWVEGTLTLEELAGSLKGLEIIGVKV